MHLHRTARAALALTVLAAAAVTGQTLLAGAGSAQTAPPSAAGVDPTVPTSPSLSTYAGVLKDGVRTFSLTAVPVRQQIATFPIRTATVWGWKATSAPDSTASSPGPTLLAYEGEKIQFVVQNRLPQPTSLHPHGTHQPNEADGAAGIDFTPIAVRETRTYPAYSPGHAGTFAYHTHTNTRDQEPRGVVGMITILPKQVAAQDNPDVDLGMTLQQWNPSPNGDVVKEGALVTPMADQRGMFPFFTINGKTGDASGGAIKVKLNDVVRIRLYNASGMTHSMHLHGQDMQVIDANGHPMTPQTVTTKAIAPGEFFTVQFRAVNPGVWAFHCSFPDHQANDKKSGYLGAPVGMLRLFQIGDVAGPPAQYFGPPQA